MVYFVTFFVFHDLTIHCVCLNLVSAYLELILKSRNLFLGDALATKNFEISASEI